MDNQRLLVWAAFGLLAFMTYQAWLQDYGPQPQPPTSTGIAPAEWLKSQTVMAPTSWARFDNAAMSCLSDVL